MSTTQQDNVVVQHAPPVPYPIKTDGTADVNGGDLVYFDTSAKVVKSMATDANGATLAGLAMNGSYIQPYNTKQYGAGQIPVLQKGIVRLKTTNGDTYAAGDVVYIGADAQTITNVDPGSGHKLGYVVFNAGITTLAGGAGVTVQIELAVAFPTTAFA